MTLHLGWYVHHHGRGHLQRFTSIARHLDADISCFSSLPVPDDLPENCRWHVLPRDDDTVDARDPRTADPTAGGLLHWAPQDHAGHRDRLAAIAAGVAARPVDAFVVDVSVEVALFVRLLGLRTVLIAQPGVRDDETHALGYRVADLIVAPWPDELLRPAHLEPFRDRVVHTGGITRYDQRRSDARRGDEVVLLGGRGGADVAEERLARTAAESGLSWRMLGAADAEWTADPWEALTSARAVVTWAGQNAIADIAAAGAPTVVVPQDRPFAEQRVTADALRDAGLAVMRASWPEPAEWPALVDQAVALRPDWSRWHVRGAAARAAAAIEGVARRRP